MYRPAKRHFADNGFISLSGGYRWYWVKKDDNFKKSWARRILCWAEDGDRIYYPCPSCWKITESYCRKDGNSDCVINGREIDTIQCEACLKCAHHHWMTFEDAVPRKAAGALRLRPKKCPSCPKSEVRLWSGFESSIYTLSAFQVDLAYCLFCHRKWRVDAIAKEKLHG